MGDLMGYIPSIGASPPDSTLSVKGKAADSKTVGDKINSLSSTATALASSLKTTNTNLTGVKNRLIASDGLQFKFGINTDGEYGYYNTAGELTPFAASRITNDVDYFILPDCQVGYIPCLKQYSRLYMMNGVNTSYAHTLTINGIVTDWDTSENVGSNSGGWGLSFYKKTHAFQELDSISLTKGSWSYGMICFLGGDTMKYNVFSSSDGTSHSITLTKNCNLIWVVGGTKSSYFTSFKINGITYGPCIANIGGQGQNSTTGWGLSAQYIMGDFKKGDVFTFTRQNATHGAVVIY